MKRLTERELDVINLVVQGLSNKEIASKLYISIHTVKSNLEHIYEKLQINNRVALAVYYMQNKETLKSNKLTLINN